MPLKNRVNPFGEIFATDARGTFMGNRGQLHNAQQQITRHSARPMWIICRLQWKSIHREIMAPNQYTELFFLDEATALAAGHRPCGECRVDALRAFQSAWALGVEGNPAGRTLVTRMDLVLKQERALVDGQRHTFRVPLSDLPDGVFITRAGLPLLKWQGHLHRWSAAGYTSMEKLAPDGYGDVLTPPSTVKTLAAGFVPEVHSSVTQSPPESSLTTG